MGSSNDWYEEFAWQDGYGAFNVGASQIAAVSEYIQNQIEHHRKKTFQEEYVAFLERYAVEYDNRYLW
jgi:REP-associated tyrosine transposase